MSEYKGHKKASELTGKEQIFIVDPATGNHYHISLSEILKIEGITQSGANQQALTDETGVSLTDESGSPLTV